MVVEDVSGESLSSRRTPQQQGDLAIGHGLFGKVIVDDQRVLGLVPEVFADAAPGIRRDVLQGGRIAGAGRDDTGVGHGVMLSEVLDHLSDGRFFLSDRDIDAFHARVLLTDDRVDADGGLADLPIADDQFALAAADGGHGIDRLKARVQRLVDRLAENHAGGDHFDPAIFRRLDGALAVQGCAGGIDDPTENGLAHGDLSDLSGSLHDVAFLDVGHLPKDRDTDVVRLQVEDHPEDSPWEFKQFHRHGVLHTINPCNAVADGEDRARFADIQLLLILLDLSGYDLADFLCLDGFHALYFLPQEIPDVV